MKNRDKKTSSSKSRNSSVQKKKETADPPIHPFTDLESRVAKAFKREKAA